MFIKKERAIWSWNYNYGEAYPMPCKNCGALVEMNTIGHRSPIRLKCPHCGFEDEKKI